MNPNPENFVLERRLNKLSDVISKRQLDITIVLENINDPHNLSACLRTCDTTGIKEVHLLYHGKQPFPKIGKTSSASAWKWIDKTRHRTVEECFAQLRSEGKKIYTTHLSHDAVSLYDMDFTQPTALVFGNEHAGVSDEAIALADGNFLIPQVGMIQSLNISVACAVSLYEVFRQRQNAGLFDTPQIKGTEFDNLLYDWVRR
jgi:tRNA (guanosine-2'-O-)-methyltransferase